MSQSTVTSASHFADLGKFQDHVLSAVENYRNHHTHIFVFEDTEPTWDSALFQILDERVVSTLSV